MLWTESTRYMVEPFDREADLEEAIHVVASELFGPARIYLDAKKKIGGVGSPVI